MAGTPNRFVDDLARILDDLYDVRDGAEDAEMPAISQKVAEAISSVESAQAASLQYRDGRLEPTA